MTDLNEAISNITPKLSSNDNSNNKASVNKKIILFSTISLLVILSIGLYFINNQPIIKNILNRITPESSVKESYSSHTTEPSIFFGAKTTNTSITNSNSINVNVSSSDPDDHYVMTDYDNSTILWMRMDEVTNANGVVDSSVYSNNGTNKTTSYQNASGKFGKAFRFGTNGITVNHSLSLISPSVTGEVSMSTWFNIRNLNQSSAFPRVIGKETNAVNREYLIYFLNSSKRMVFSIGNYTNNFDIQLTKENWNQSQWYLLTITFSNTSGLTSFYVDGENLMNFTTTSSYRKIINSTGNLTIGSSATGSPFEGSLDEVIIFNRVLSPQEIKALYNTSKNQYLNNFTNASEGNHTFKSYAVDIAGNQNQTELRNVLVDTGNPTTFYGAKTQNDSTFITYNSTYINVTANDTISGVANITIRLYNTTALLRTNVSATSNYSINYTAFADGVYRFNTTASDQAGNIINLNTRTVTIDTQTPKYFNLTNFPANETEYSPSRYYFFNSTWTDTNMQSVNIEFAGVNYSAQNVAGNIWNFTIRDLGAGVYNYYWFGNDSAGNRNVTSTFSYTVSQNTSIVYTYINHSRADLTVYNGTSVTLNGSLINGPSTINISLYVNGSLWNVGPSPLSNTSVFNTIGTYLINTTYLGNQNYSYADEIWTLTVVSSVTPTPSPTVSAGQCKYKKFGYFNTRLPWLRQENCI